MNRILHHIAVGVEILGMFVIIWGAAVSLVRFVQLEYLHVTGVNICSKREYLRHHLGSYLLLGLEFLVAGDIIATMLHPEIKSLISLGVIVIIRTVLSYFLTKELKDGHDCGADREKPAEEKT